jgi:hypothetical protein
MRPMSSTAFCNDIRSSASNGRDTKAWMRFLQRAVAFLKRQRALGVRSFGLHGVRQAPMPAEGLSRATAGIPRSRRGCTP